MISQKESTQALSPFNFFNCRQDLGVVPGFGFGPESESEVVAANGVASMSEVIYGFEIGIVVVCSVLGIISNALLGQFANKSEN